MVQAANISSAEYACQVRHTMSANALGVELTGGMNLDYLSYKRSLHALVATLGERGFFDLLADPATRTLAHHLDQLLLADLLDWDRHIELTARLVGAGAALHQREDSSAVMTLRTHQYRAILSYGHLLEHGDQILRYFIPGNLDDAQQRCGQP